LINNIKLSVPRFIYTSKLETDVTERVEDAFLQAHFNLPDNIDVLPTFLGTIYSYRGAALFLILCFFLGIAFALLDVWIHKEQTLWTLVTQIAIVYCVVLYERDTGTYFATARGVLLLVIMLKVGAVVTRVLQRPMGDARIRRRRRRPITVVRVRELQMTSQDP
jgi:hypothetical protein